MNLFKNLTEAFNFKTAGLDAKKLQENQIFQVRSFIVDQLHTLMQMNEHLRDEYDQFTKQMNDLIVRRESMGRQLDRLTKQMIELYNRVHE